MVRAVVVVALAGPTCANRVTRSDELALTAETIAQMSTQACLSLRSSLSVLIMTVGADQGRRLAEGQRQYCVPAEGVLEGGGVLHQGYRSDS